MSLTSVWMCLVLMGGRSARPTLAQGCRGAVATTINGNVRSTWSAGRLACSAHRYWRRTLRFVPAQAWCGAGYLANNRQHSPAKSCSPCCRPRAGPPLYWLIRLDSVRLSWDAGCHPAALQMAPATLRHLLRAARSPWWLMAEPLVYQRHLDLHRILCCRQIQRFILTVEVS